MSVPRTDPFYHAALDPLTAVAIALLGIANLLFVQLALASAGVPLVVTIALAEVALALAAVVVARWRRADLASLRAALGLAWPRARFLAAGALVGAAAWYVNLRLLDWLTTPDDRELGQLVGREPLAATLVAIAFVPALCEELVFRGVLARALARRLPALAAIAIAAAAFALMHGRAVQLVPTFTLGLALGFVAVRADSAIPAMLAHAINNAIAIALSRDELPALARWLGANPEPALAAAIVSVGVGLALAARSAA